MNAMYGVQRHFYDATRWCFLLGRDELLRGVKLFAGARVVEIGCGTGRNLARLAERAGELGLAVGGGASGRDASGGNAGVSLVGIDASTEMLKTAEAKLGRQARTRGVVVMHGWAEDGWAERVREMLGKLEGDAARVGAGADGGVDAVVFSYSLSMIPAWRAAFGQAMELVKTGGSVHIVDFGDQAGWPRWLGVLMRWWLGRFGVRGGAEMGAWLRGIEAGGGWGVGVRTIGRGYAFVAVMRKL